MPPRRLFIIAALIAILIAMPASVPAHADPDPVIMPPGQCSSPESEHGCLPYQMYLPIANREGK